MKKSLVPRLAIVVHAVGDIESLEGTLVSVLENRPGDCEIVVALNQPYADPYELRDEVRFVEAPRRHRPIAAIHAAIAETRAPFVHLLASGCRVTEGWADEALARFGDRRVASVAPLAMDATDNERIFAAGVGYRRGGKRFLVGHGQSGLATELTGSIVGAAGFAAFYRKSAIDFIGGFSKQLGLQQADVDLGLMLARAGFTTCLERRSVVFASSVADPSDGAFAQALHEERLFWRNLPAEQRLSVVARHATQVAFELLASLPRPRLFAQLAGRLLAASQITGYARHRHALAQLGQRAVQPKSGSEHLRIDRPHRVPVHSQAATVRVNAR